MPGNTVGYLDCRIRFYFCCYLCCFGDKVRETWWRWFGPFVDVLSSDYVGQRMEKRRRGRLQRRFVNVVKGAWRWLVLRKQGWDGDRWSTVLWPQKGTTKRRRKRRFMLLWRLSKEVQPQKLDSKFAITWSISCVKNSPCRSIMWFWFWLWHDVTRTTGNQKKMFKGLPMSLTELKKHDSKQEIMISLYLNYVRSGTD